MRNHKKVKVLRTKYKNGYAIWSMLLEYLTGEDGNEFEHSDEEYLLISGDFGFDQQEIKDVVEDCLKMQMLFSEGGFIYSESLNTNLKPVYDKRKVAKEHSEKRQRKNGKFVIEKAQPAVIPIQPPAEEAAPPEAGKTEGKFDFKKSLLAFGFQANFVDDWLKVRKSKKAANTETAFNGFIKQVKLTGMPINDVLRECAEKSWAGLKAEWLTNNTARANNNGNNSQDTREWTTV